MQRNIFGKEKINLDVQLSRVIDTKCIQVSTGPRLASECLPLPYLGTYILYELRRVLTLIPGSTGGNNKDNEQAPPAPASRMNTRPRTTLTV